ncbi:hypothetical protein [Taibaiella helva]|uniref:hypothetical protein n=1 Tax=Taibaiella helva TaxID=2301235 RepID=UPI000E591BE5|nr:hypothetical protein [Taibaiella helva]
MNILPEIAWAFKRKAYVNEQAFDQEIAAYQSAILKERARWNASQVVIPAAAIDVCYEAWIKGKEDLRPNETLLDEEEAFDEDNGDNGFYQVEVCARLKAANDVHFTALDLMYQLQQQTNNKELGDHIFFEGLTLSQEESFQSDVPLYYLDCGS